MNKYKLIIKIFKTFSFTSSLRFLAAHLFKRKYVSVFIKSIRLSIVLRPWTGDFATLRQVLWDKEYDFELEGVKSIIDLGANIGISTIVLANKFPEARIIALEPESSNFQLLKKNTAGLKNVSILNYAIWYEDGVLGIENTSVKSNEFRFVSHAGSPANDLIKSISINSLADKYELKSIDLLKMDIEGAEEEVFKDPLWLAKIRCLIIEVHSNHFKNALMDIMQFDFFYSIKGEKLFFTKK